VTLRSDLLTLLERNRRRMDAERREFAKRAVEIVTRNSPGERFDQLAYVRTRNALEPLFDAYYGQFPSDRRARFWALIVEEARLARALAFRRAVQDVRRRLKSEPGLLRAIRWETA
jgi:hypothetical protein